MQVKNRMDPPAATSVTELFRRASGAQRDEGGNLCELHELLSHPSLPCGLHARWCSHTGNFLTWLEHCSAMIRASRMMNETKLYDLARSDILKTACETVYSTDWLIRLLASQKAIPQTRKHHPSSKSEARRIIQAQRVRAQGGNNSGSAYSSDPRSWFQLARTRMQCRCRVGTYAHLSHPS